MLWNKWIPRFICVFLVLCLLCSVSLFAVRRTEQSFVVPDSSALENTSNRHAHPESEAPAVASLSTDGYELKLQNDTLELWYRADVCGIRVRDKRSGYVWGSVDSDEAEGLNKKWNAMANSVCTLEYLDQKYNVTKVSISDSSVTVKDTWKADSAEFRIALKRQDISFSFSITLHADSITVSMDDASISEGDAYLIKDIYFLPFFGCALEDSIDGYLFIPDGCGALMRFSKSADYISGYSQKVYGSDMGIDQLTQVNDLVATRTNDYLIDSAQITVPVYGVVHGAGQNAVMTVIESGEEYAYIEATPANSTIRYSRISACFHYRQMYTHTVGKTGGGVYRPQKDRNVINPSLTLSFLSGADADYAGMAVKYRSYLEQNGDLSAERADSQIPLALNVVGAEIAEGGLFNYTRKFTEVDEALEMLETLAGRGIKNITMLYDGWQKGGINGSSYGTVKTQSGIGSRADFEALSGRLSDSGGRLYLSANVTTANKDQISPQRSAALQLSKQYAVFSRANTSVMYSNYYVIKPPQLMSTLLRYEEKLSGFDFFFGQLGYRLYSDYTANAEITRSEFRDALTGTLSQLSAKTAFSNPNEYLWRYTSEYFDMPMCSSQYLYETDTVPFLQILLKGSVDYYAPYMNQSGYSTADVLKMIEFGAYPSLITAAADNYDLQGTPLEDYFSISFEDWLGTATEVYSRVNEALSPVEGSRISDHTVLAEGVARVDYENGVSIFVNYNAEEYTGGTAVVPAFGFAVIGGTQP